MTIAKTSQGAWRISDIIDGLLVSRVYFFYTRKEAVTAFKKEFKQRGK